MIADYTLRTLIAKSKCSSAAINFRNAECLEKVYQASEFLPCVHSVSPAFRHQGQFGATGHCPAMLSISHFYFINLMLMTPESFLVIAEQIQKLW
jgi:hypothetical protein